MKPGGLWDASGPRSFLGTVADRCSTSAGTVCIRLPDPAPEGALEAIRRSLRDSLGVRALVADASSGLGARGPVHWLAARAAMGATGIRSVPDFLDAAPLANVVFLVHGVPRRDWRAWSYFLRTVRDERKRRERVAAPVVALVPDASLPGPEIEAAFAAGGVVQWLGMVGRLDAEACAEAARRCRAEDCDLAGRAAFACAVEVGGWDHRLVDELAAASAEDAINPMPLIREMAAGIPSMVPMWSNGLVDLWDGAPFEHALSLVARGREGVVLQRVWRAHMRAVYPFLDRVRIAVARRYRRELLASGSWRKTNRKGELVEEIHDPDGFEISVMRGRLKPHLGAVEARFLLLCYETRNKLAHHVPAQADWITAMSLYWDAHSGRYPDDTPGWDWPRCGQRLVVLAGPPSAERTTAARARMAGHDFVAQKLDGAPGSNAEAKWRSHEDARRSLSAGRTVVLDGDGSADLDVARGVPLDIPIVFLAPDGTLDPWDIDGTGKDAGEVGARIDEDSQAAA